MLLLRSRKKKPLCLGVWSILYYTTVYKVQLLLAPQIQVFRDVLGLKERFPAWVLLTERSERVYKHDPLHVLPSPLFSSLRIISSASFCFPRYTLFSSSISPFLRAKIWENIFFFKKMWLALCVDGAVVCEWTIIKSHFKVNSLMI